MTINDLRSLASAAMQGDRHVDPDQTLAMLAVLSERQRSQAAAIYQTLVNEATLPRDFGRKHALPVLLKPAKGRSRIAREAQARRILEERRDMRESS